MPEREPNQEQQKAAIIFSIQQSVPEGPLRNDLLKAVQDTFAQHQASKLVTRADVPAPTERNRPNTAAELTAYLNDPQHREELYSGTLERVAKSLGWEATPHPQLPGLSIWWKPDAATTKTRFGDVMDSVMIAGRGTEFMYVHKYFIGIGQGQRVAQMIEPASLQLPVDELSNLKSGRGMFAEQGAMLGFLQKQGKVVRGE